MDDDEDSDDSHLYLEWIEHFYLFAMRLNIFIPTLFYLEITIVVLFLRLGNSVICLKSRSY